MDLPWSGAARLAGPPCVLVKMREQTIECCDALANLKIHPGKRTGKQVKTMLQLLYWELSPKQTQENQG